MNKNDFRVVGTQIILTIISATAIYFLDDPLAAKSVMWGSSASLANGIMLAWKVREASGAENCSPGEHLKAMYRASLERYAVAILLLALSLGAMGLAPQFVVAGFVVGQVGLVAARLLMNRF